MALQQCFRSITSQVTLYLDYFITLIVALWQCSNIRKKEKEEKIKKEGEKKKGKERRVKERRGEQEEESGVGNILGVAGWLPGLLRFNPCIPQQAIGPGCPSGYSYCRNYSDHLTS